MTAVMSPVSSDVLRAWWAAGAWDQLTPHIDAAIRRAVSTYRPSPDDVDDCVQQVLIRCWMLTVEIPANPRQYVSRMARNLWYDTHTTKKCGHARKVSSVDADRVLETCASPEPDILRSLIAGENRARLKAALHQMPDAHRRPLVLRHLHSWSITALAEHFHVKEGAIKMQLVRARQMLGEIYKRLGPIPLKPELTIEPTTEVVLKYRHPVPDSTLSVRDRLAGYFDVGCSRPMLVPVVVSPHHNRA
jgi:RNA polymerase sigma factor (sigma-70 family)